MQKKYIIIIGSILILIIAGVADWMNFRTNGGHTGNSIIGSNESVMREVARAWIERSAPTYVFDGTNLTAVDRGETECAECAVFSFESSHGGYGNRDGLLITQVVVPHTIIVEIKNGKVVRAVTDGKYNELTGAFAE